jgi:hypothetical protein
MLTRSAKGVEIRQLLIVSRAEPERYEYLRYVFDSETGEVILDRRVLERRRRRAPVPADRRRSDRRQRDVSADLRVFGWALVRYDTRS